MGDRSDMNMSTRVGRLSLRPRFLHPKGHTAANTATHVASRRHGSESPVGPGAASLTSSLGDAGLPFFVCVLYDSRSGEGVAKACIMHASSAPAVLRSTFLFPVPPPD